MIPADLRKYKHLLPDNSDLRMEDVAVQRIVIVNGDLAEDSTTKTGGTAARTIRKGKLGFASAPGMDHSTVEKLIRSASENSALLSQNTSEYLEIPHTSAAEVIREFKLPESFYCRDSMFEMARNLDSVIRSRYSDLTSSTVNLTYSNCEKQFISASGTFGKILLPRGLVFILFTMEYNGEPVKLSRKLHETPLTASFFSDHEKHLPMLDELYESLRRKAEGIQTEPGIHECILGAEITGILAHEAVGHTVESDNILGGSVAADLLNRRVASPLVTLVDFATEFQGKTLPVPVYMDEEGIPGKDVTVINRGILQNYLHDRKTAARFNTAPAGNARAFYYNQEPVVRMRNTGILPGKDTVEDMIASVENGYYLVNYQNGQADSTGEFMFGVTEGYRIKNGKLGKALRDTTLSGVAFNMLKTVSAVSSEMVWTNGSCGKKYGIPVGTGGPSLKCRMKVGG